MARHSALIVDADPSSAKLLSVVLERAGWLAVVAHSAEAGRRVLELLRLDIVLFEPGSNTDLVNAHIHALRRAGADRVPVVVVSANDHQDASHDPACADYIRKPIDVSAFATQLVQLLEPAS